jgi:hypothetical protein
VAYAIARLDVAPIRPFVGSSAQRAPSSASLENPF